MRTIIGVFLGLFLVMAANAAEFVLTSTAFTEREVIPDLYSCDGKNISPALAWKNPPNDTQAFALILSSPDAPGGIFYNWVLYNIPSDMKSFPEGFSEVLPRGILVGNTSIGDAIYRGPCPPDNLKHHYVFTLYALDAPLDLVEGADIEIVLLEIKRHLLSQAQLSGVFRH